MKITLLTKIPDLFKGLINENNEIDRLWNEFNQADKLFWQKLKEYVKENKGDIFLGEQHYPIIMQYLEEINSNQNTFLTNIKKTTCLYKLNDILKTIYNRCKLLVNYLSISCGISLKISESFPASWWYYHQSKSTFASGAAKTTEMSDTCYAASKIFDRHEKLKEIIINENLQSIENKEDLANLLLYTAANNPTTSQDPFNAKNYPNYELLELAMETKASETIKNAIRNNCMNIYSAGTCLLLSLYLFDDTSLFEEIFLDVFNEVYLSFPDLVGVKDSFLIYSYIAEIDDFLGYVLKLLFEIPESDIGPNQIEFLKSTINLTFSYTATDQIYFRLMYLYHRSNKQINCFVAKEDPNRDIINKYYSIWNDSILKKTFTIEDLISDIHNANNVPHASRACLDFKWDKKEVKDNYVSVLRKH